MDLNSYRSQALLGLFPTHEVSNLARHLFFEDEFYPQLQYLLEAKVETESTEEKDDEPDAWDDDAWGVELETSLKISFSSDNLTSLVALNQLSGWAKSLAVRYPIISNSHEITILVSGLRSMEDVGIVETILELVMGWVKDVKSSTLAVNVVLGGGEPTVDEVTSFLGDKWNSDRAVWIIEEYLLSWVANRFPNTKGQVAITCRAVPILRLVPVAKDVWLISSIPEEFGISHLENESQATFQISTVLNTALGVDMNGYMYSLGSVSKRVGKELAFNKQLGSEQEEHTVLLVDRIYDIATCSLPPTHMLDAVDDDVILLSQAYHGDGWEKLVDASNVSECETVLAQFSGPSIGPCNEIISIKDAGELVDAQAEALSRLRASSDPSLIFDNESTEYFELALGRFRKMLANGIDLQDAAPFLILAYSLGGRLVCTNQNDMELLVESDLITITGCDEALVGSVMDRLRHLANTRTELTSDIRHYCHETSPGPIHGLSFFFPLVLRLLDLASPTSCMWPTRHADLECLSRPLRDKKPSRVVGRLLKHLLPTSSPGETNLADPLNDSIQYTNSLILVYIGGVSFSELSAVRKWSKSSYIPVKIFFTRHLTPSVISKHLFRPLLHQV